MHPSNRDGQGVHWYRAHSRVSAIKKAGFSWSASRENCVAIEDHPIAKAIAKNTVKQVSMSEKYAKYRVGDIRAGTLGAGHATHGFACLYDEVPCDIPNISEDGKVSRRKCFENDSKREHATLQGLKFRVLKWEIEAVFPTIPKIIQAALNTVTQIAEGHKY